MVKFNSQKYRQHTPIRITAHTNNDTRKFQLSPAAVSVLRMLNTGYLNHVESVRVLYYNIMNPDTHSTTLMVLFWHLIFHLCIKSTRSPTQKDCSNIELMNKNAHYKRINCHVENSSCGPAYLIFFFFPKTFCMSNKQLNLHIYCKHG